MKRIFTFFLVLAVCASCGGDPTSDDPKNPNGGGDKPTPGEPTYSVNGNVQKGPFTLGTSITIQALDDTLNPTGKSYQTKTTDDAGTFKINNQIESRYVEIIAAGYYFNEISGRVSNSTITLRALSDLTETGKTNVNLLTTLESDRMRKLVTESGMSISSSREQAEKELFDVFHIPNAVSSSSGFDKMDITQGGESNAILLAISGTLQGQRSEGELSELVSKIASDIASSGNISNDIIKDQIRMGGMTVNAEQVRTNLTARYKALGVKDYEIPPFEDYLDINGNGVIDKKDSWLILNQKEFQFSDEGGTIEVDLQHNIDYDVTIEAEGSEWITTTNTRAYLETDKLTYTVAPNDTYDARYARIAVKDRNSSRTEYITVSQKQHDALTVTSDRYELDKNGGTIDVEVKANINFTIDIPAEYRNWITQVPATRGLTSTILQFKIAPSQEENVREGEILIKNGSLSETITVYQTGGKVLVLNQKEYTVSDKGTTVEVEVTSNVDYEIIMPSANWITQTQQTRGIITNTRSFTISPNTIYDARDAEIIFRDKNSSLQEKVIIYQTQKDAIVIAKKSYAFDNSGGSLALDLQANVNIEVEIPNTCKDWITQIQTRSLIAQTLNFTIAANTNYDKREGEIIVKNAQSGLSETIKIYQAQKNAIILTQNEYALTDKGGNITVEVKSNVDFAVDISGGGAWLHQISTRGLVSHTLNFTVEPNTAYGSRDAVITIINTSNNLNETIKVHQSQKDAIILGSDKYELPYTGGNVDINIKSNINYEVAITEGASWITRAEATRALTESTVSLKIAKNGDITDRIGKVLIRDMATGITNTVTITQAGSAEAHTIHVAEAGTLGSLLSDTQKANLISVKITGTINKADFKVMEEQMPRLSELDLTEVTVPGNQIPAEAMCTTGAMGSITTYNSKSNLRKLLLPQNATTINENAFGAMKQLTEVALPQSLTSLREGSFINAEKLERVDIPDNVTIIGKLAFANCFSLASVNFTPNSKLQRIESVMGGDGIGQTVTDGAFRSCYSLRRFEIPAGVTVIGAGTFYDCTTLEELIIPSNTALTRLTGFVYKDEYVLGSKTQAAGIVEKCYALKTLHIPAKIRTIDNYAFANCGVENIIFEEGSVCSKLGEAVFANCRSLNDIDIPQSVKVLGNCVFINCESLENIDLSRFTSVGKTLISGCASLKSIVLPNYLTKLDGGFFQGCTSIESCVLPKSINAIGANAFKDCIRLKTINIPAAVTAIGSKAFSGCVSLESIAIPSKVNDMGSEHSSTYTAGAVFEGCTNLKEFTLSGNPSIEFQGDTFENCISLKTVHLNAAKLILGSNEFKGTPITRITIPAMMESITGSTVSPDTYAPSTWYGSNVNEFIFEQPSQLTQVGKGAFAGSNITSLVLPETVTELGDGVIGLCSSLIDWEIPAHIKKLSGNPYYKSNVSNPRLNSNTRLEYVGNYAFSEMHGMTSVDISSATYVGGSVFTNCYDLQEVKLPANMTAIPEYMFYGCALLESVNIPSAITQIGNYAFQNCGSLKRIDLSKVTKIGWHAFENCMLLSDVDLSSASDIGGNFGATFANCSSLNSVKLRSSGELFIGGCAFYGCQNLKTVTIPAGITKLSGSFYDGVGAQFKGGQFAGTSAEIIIEPNSQIQTLGKYAFSGATSLTEITLPNFKDLKYLEGSIFQDCNNLIHCNFPALILVETSFDSFKGCQSLEEIEMPSLQNLNMNFFNSISSSAFKRAILPETLTKVEDLDDFKPLFGELICNAIVPPTNWDTIISQIDCTLRVPSGSINAYKSHASWSKFAKILPIE